MTRDPLHYFRIEAREIVEALEDGVLRLERGEPPGPLLRSLLRHAHTLKGAARVVSQPRIAEVAHEIEERLSGAAPSEGLDAEGVATLLHAIDGVKALAHALEPPETKAAPARPASVDGASVRELTGGSLRMDLCDLDALTRHIHGARSSAAGTRRAVSELDEPRRLLDQLIGRLERRGASALPELRIADEVRAALRARRQRIERDLDEVELHLDDAQGGVRDVRLVRAGTLFGELGRAVRDAADELEKSVAFATRGGEERVDANVLEAVRVALLHLVRNAVAHGIEEDRWAAGKPPQGTVTVEVAPRGRRVALRCTDDGAGIDVQAVRRALRRAGVELGDDATEAEVLRHLATGGVTTRARVSPLAGRGVGLDAARVRLEAVGGTLTLSTHALRGTTAEIVVPISRSVVTALTLRAAGRAVVVPLEAVRSTHLVAPEAIARGRAALPVAAEPYVPVAGEASQGGASAASAVAGPSVAADADTVELDGRVLELHWLARLLGERVGSSVEPATVPVVILDTGSSELALAVERLEDVREVVVWPLPDVARLDPMIAGAVLELDGPRLVLAPEHLAPDHLAPEHVAARVARASTAAPPVGPRAPILVIDDSVTSRMLERSILESAGYEVELASCGEEALELARRRPFSLFLVDVEMPGMSGLDFVEQTRADAQLSCIPAVIVSSRGTAEDLRRGSRVGASAYLVKDELDQRRLVATLSELLGGPA